ncbi:MAG: hypothetical protein TREMPRED_002480 [Tremellales sp. Tagirdzhanova-0007]|nr:MAG: hypothetical protein TREMPRED_002480 [Tremellales sp. Tagirdzhanova-0007]
MAVAEVEYTVKLLSETSDAQAHTSAWCPLKTCHLRVKLDYDESSYTWTGGRMTDAQTALYETQATLKDRLVTSLEACYENLPNELAVERTQSNKAEFIRKVFSELDRGCNAVLVRSGALTKPEPAPWDEFAFTAIQTRGPKWTLWGSLTERSLYLNITYKGTRMSGTTTSATDETRSSTKVNVYWCDGYQAWLGRY